MEMPAYNKISLSYLGLGIWYTDLVESLKMTISSGFEVNMSLPDNQVTAKVKVQSAGMNIAEEALGEHHSKNSRLDTNVTIAAELSGLNLNSVLSTLVNLIGIFTCTTSSH